MEVFFITPVKPPPKPKKLDEDGNEIEEEAPAEELDPEEEAKKWQPKFQTSIYPDSTI